MDKHITIVQIAKESKVSIATVSRVINGTVPVAPATRRRVENVIRKYNFSPNEQARSLICQHTKMVGVVLPDIVNPYFASIFRCIQQQAAEAGYSAFLCNTDFTSADKGAGKEEAFLKMLQTHKADGAIVVGGSLDLMEPGEDYLLALQQTAERIPVVAVGRAVPGIKCRFVEPDGAAGIALAVHHLAEYGHKRIAFLGGEDGITVTQARRQAYRCGMQAMGLALDDKLEVLSNYYTPDGYASAEELLRRKTPFTAALAVNDNVAVGAIRAFADNGLRVPDDIAVVSCDQFFNADYTSPRLSSVHRDDRQLAEYVTRTLLHLMRHELCEPAPATRAELTVRESSGKPL